MSRPRVYCDFNDRIDAETFGLDKLGTLADLERQNLQLTPGLEIVVYADDAFDNGEPAFIAADAVVEQRGARMVARLQGKGFRWEPRREHAARIFWSDDLVKQGLPTFLRTTDPSWFADDIASEGWSLICEFRSSPRDQGSPSSATVQFMVDNAPHDRLRVGTRLQLFERATGSRAAVDILD